MRAFKMRSGDAAPVTIRVRRGVETVQIPYQQVFAVGHDLWLKARFDEAAKVFQRLSCVTDRGPRAHILLSHCKAMLGDYGGCSSTLSSILPIKQYWQAAVDLHEVFVMWKCSFYLDVRRGLEKVVIEQTELPTPCLILAEFLMQAGNYTQPPRLLREAIERDRPNGAIAMIASDKLPSAMALASNFQSEGNSRDRT